MPRSKGETTEPTGDEARVPELPGSALFAGVIERRQFLRKAANVVFFTVAGTMVGSVALARSAIADPSKANAQGPCCPTCCGPSPCCNTSCCSKPCCSYNSTTCANNGPCLGPDYRDYRSGCWSCVYSRSVVTCCDCVTNNTSGCPNYINRCICYNQRRYSEPSKAPPNPSRRSPSP